MTDKLPYQYCCVTSPDIEELFYIVDNAREITYRTLLKHVDCEDLKALCRSWGYCRNGLHLSHDWAVSYYKSKLQCGARVYYIRHSAIEYIFFRGGDAT